MTHIFYVILKSKNPITDGTIIFYDCQKDTAIKEMRKYVKNNGFSIKTHDGIFTISDVVLVEKEGANIINETSYRKIFDVITGKLINQNKK